MRTSFSGSRYGSGRSSRPRTTLKTLVVAPIATASVSTTTAANAGLRASSRSAPRRLHRRDEFAQEFSIVAEIHQRQQRRMMPGDDRIDVGERCERPGDGLRIPDAAGAVVHVQRRDRLVREDVAGVQDAQRRKNHPGVAAGVSRTEVVKLDALVAGAERHPILESAGGKAAPGALLEDVRLDRAPGDRAHL